MARGARLGGRARPNDEGDRAFFSKAAATWGQPRHPAATTTVAPLACPGSATASGSAGGGLRASGEPAAPAALAAPPWRWCLERLRWLLWRQRRRLCHEIYDSITHCDPTVTFMTVSGAAATFP